MAVAEQRPIAAPETCYHCGEPVPAGVSLFVDIDGQARPMCCPGCRAVAGLIAGSGLDSFYRRRSSYSERPGEPADTAGEYRVYDDPELAGDFSSSNADGSVSARLLLGGISCAACTWLIEQALSRVPGILAASVQLQHSRLDLRFDPARIPLSEIFARVEALGYRPQPFRADTRREQLSREYRADLRRLGVAGFGMMQVGMFAVALHAGDLQGIEEQYRGLLRGFSLLVSGFVVYYAAGIFFRTAWRHLRQGALVMDLPVALAIGLAWLASAWATLTGSGQVYFDSVVMFTFFLLLGRFLEARVRRHYALAWFDVEAALPDAVSVRHEGQWVTRPRRLLRPGDRVLVRPGQTVPADASVVDGIGAVREDTFNGEHLPRTVHPGETIYAGSVNVESALQADVLVDFAHSRLAALQQSVDAARSGKPKLARLADRIAGWFVAGVLLLTAGTAAVWLQLDPSRALWVSLSVLVISCPCALALATPAALTAAAASLRSAGVIVRGENALESLGRCTHLLFDKTGTLTEGSLAVERVLVLGDCDARELLELAAGLQQFSNHPISRAFANTPANTAFAQVVHIAGAGLEGEYDGLRYRMGSAAFCRALCPVLPEPPEEPLYWVAMCREEQPLAWIGFSDPTREEAPAVIAAARAAGVRVGMLSGDSSPRAAQLAAELGIEVTGSGLQPQEKLRRLRELQDAGAVVAMVGDGLNDAPVLGAADASFAVAGATDLARAQADFVLAGDLGGVTRSWGKARACRRIILQNFAWALGYNLLAIPLAASGHVPPWAAAIGMSLSSLLVVTNSLRLHRSGVAAPEVLRG